MQIYNLHEDNFKTLNEFNDYLEEVEDIVFNLVHEIDVDATEQKIRQFRDTRQETIERNRRRPNADQLWINKILEEETSRTKRGNSTLTTMENKKTTIANPRDIIDELRDSDLPAEVVLDRQRKLQIEAELEEKEETLRRKRDKHGMYGFLLLGMF